MSNPFDNRGGIFAVLVNDQRQYSIWPATIEAPAGWSVAREPDTREACIEYVNVKWADMRPKPGAVSYNS